MMEMLGEIRVVLSTMDYMVGRDAVGDLPDDIDFHYMMQELIRTVRRQMGDISALVILNDEG